MPPHTRAATHRLCALPRSIDDVYELIADNGNTIDVPQGDCRSIIFQFDANFAIDLPRLRNTYPRAAHFSSQGKYVTMNVADACYFHVYGNGNVICAGATSLDDIDAAWHWVYSRVLCTFKQ